MRLCSPDATWRSSIPKCRAWSPMVNVMCAWVTRRLGSSDHDSSSRLVPSNATTECTTEIGVTVSRISRAASSNCRCKRTTSRSLRNTGAHNRIHPIQSMAVDRSEAARCRQPRSRRALMIKVSNMCFPYCRSLADMHAAIRTDPTRALAAALERTRERHDGRRDVDQPERERIPHHPVIVATELMVVPAVEPFADGELEQARRAQQRPTPARDQWRSDQWHDAVRQHP